MLGPDQEADLRATEDHAIGALRTSIFNLVEIAMERFNANNADA
jgi:hypothetical protein